MAFEILGDVVMADIGVETFEIAPSVFSIEEEEPP